MYLKINLHTEFIVLNIQNILKIIIHKIIHNYKNIDKDKIYFYN